MKAALIVVGIIAVALFFYLTIPLVRSVFPLDSAEKVAAFFNYVYTAITFVTLLAVFGAALAAYRQLKLINDQTKFLAEQTKYVGEQTKYLGDQTAAMSKAVQTGAVQAMVASHRELLGRVVDHPELFKVLRGEEMTTTPAETIYLSMLLNHGFHAFTLREHEYIDEDWWVAIKKDMRNLLGREAARRWWKEVKEYYPSRYRIFIDTEILGS